MKVDSLLITIDERGDVQQLPAQPSVKQSSSQTKRQLALFLISFNEGWSGKLRALGILSEKY